MLTVAVTLLAVTIPISDLFSDDSDNLAGAVIDSGNIRYEIISSSPATVRVYDCLTEPSGAISIPSAVSGYTVVEIGNGLTGPFYGKEGLTSIILPTTVKTINAGSFSGCINLTTVTNMSGVKTIGVNAFYNCVKLTTGTLDAATSIGVSAFQNCNALTAVTAPALTSLGDSAFYDCDLLNNISMPLLTTVPPNAFYNSVKVTTVNISSATSIQTAAFQNCNGIQRAAATAGTGNITVGNVLTVGDNAFYNCDSLASVILPKATSIGNSAFYNCPVLTDFTADKAVSLGTYSLYMGRFTDLYLPEVKIIGEQAFGGCNILVRLSIPAATTIGADVFYGCSSVKILDARSVPIATNSVFAWLTNLEEVDISGATSYSPDAFWYYQDGYVSSLKKIIAPGLTSLPEHAFNLYKNLEYADVRGAADIGDGAFYFLTKLNTVITDSAVSVGDTAFYGCSSLRSIDLPLADSVGEMAFYASGLFSVNAPNLKTIGKGGFQGCGYLSDVELPSVRTIGDSAFLYCGSLTAMDLPVSLTRIGNDAFQFTGLRSITIPVDADIGIGAFGGLTSMVKTFYVGADKVSAANNGGEISLTITPTDGQTVYYVTARTAKTGGTIMQTAGSLNSWTYNAGGVSDIYVTVSYGVILFDANDNTGTIQPVGELKGSTVKLPGTGLFSRARYIQIMWNTAADGSGQRYSFGQQITMPIGELELYAVWVPELAGSIETANEVDLNTVTAPTAAFAIDITVSDNTIRAVTVLSSCAGYSNGVLTVQLNNGTGLLNVSLFVVYEDHNGVISFVTWVFRIFVIPMLVAV